MAVALRETLAWLRAGESARRERVEAARQARLARLPEVARVLRAAGATRIALFGSLAEGRHFREESDVDLAVEGLDPGQVVALRPRLEALLGRDVDLVDPADVPASLRERIESEGRAL